MASIKGGTLEGRGFDLSRVEYKSWSPLSDSEECEKSANVKWPFHCELTLTLSTPIILFLEELISFWKFQTFRGHFQLSRNAWHLWLRSIRLVRAERRKENRSIFWTNFERRERCCARKRRQLSSKTSERKLDLAERRRHGDLPKQNELKKENLEEKGENINLPSYKKPISPSCHHHWPFDFQNRWAFLLFPFFVCIEHNRFPGR